VYEKRLETELDIIKGMGFSGYMLVVADYVNAAKKMGIGVGAGRGSAAGSLVCWVLDITTVDPIKYGLLFERFLNPDRISMPDIDVDFAHLRRGEVKEYTAKKYGQDKVASILTLGTMAARGALKDSCRCMEISYADADKFSKAIPDNVRGKNVYLKTITDPGHDDYDKDFMKVANSRPDYKEALRRALMVEGMTKSSGTHAAGVVISDHRDLVYHTGLQVDKEGNIVTSYTMDVLEKIMGLIKFDLLGLKTITTNQLACEFIKENYDIDIDLDHIPLDDADTYNLLCSGNLAGIFQLSGSSGFKEVTTQIQPRNVEEIGDITSLYRPGPLDNGFIPKYVKAKNTGVLEYMISVGNQDVQLRIDEILKPTKGVIIYQEQVMKLAQIMGGYTLAQADLLRRAMGKKIEAEMEVQRKTFTEGCLNNNIKEDEAIKAFDAIAKFAEYGFNKSHAIAYSIITYQTAYLKAHYPIEFMAASLTEVAGDQDKTITFLNDCKANRIDVLPPDINQSKLAYTPTEKGIRFGLGAVKNLGDIAVNSIIKSRESGKFTNLFDFVARVDKTKVNTAKIQTLIRAGCFDEVA
jgi:DNA polymerase-3 subunit alpha